MEPVQLEVLVMMTMSFFWGKMRYNLINYYKLFGGTFSLHESPVEAGSNTSTVALRVIGNDEKEVLKMRQ
jgi:hypothetical protein